MIQAERAGYGRARNIQIARHILISLSLEAVFLHIPVLTRLPFQDPLKSFSRFLSETSVKSQ